MKTGNRRDRKPGKPGTGKPGTDGTFFREFRGGKRIVFGILAGMARLARVVAVDVPQHVTQRGNARQYIFEKDSDRCVYLELLSQYAALHELALAGYCLMSNHVHLVVIPHREDSLAATLKNTH
jgi:hypothetical protein